MSKILPLILLITLTLQADFWRFEAGGGVWKQSGNGTMRHSDDTHDLDLDGTLGIDDTQDIYLWAYLKHPLPLIPNVRLEYTKSAFDGKSDAAFHFDGKDYPLDTPYDLSFKQIDAILYYNLLDNLLWLTLDVGIDAAFMRFDASLQEESYNADVVVPQLYARIRVELPLSGFAFEGEGKYFTFSDSAIGDLRLKIDYTFDTPLVQPGIEAGYRYLRIDLDSGDYDAIDTTLDMTLSGIYLGGFIRF